MAYEDEDYLLPVDEEIAPAPEPEVVDPTQEAPARQEAPVEDAQASAAAEEPPLPSGFQEEPPLPPGFKVEGEEPPLPPGFKLEGGEDEVKAESGPMSAARGFAHSLGPAATGALAGGTLGSVVPGIGTIAGGLIGGFLGGTLGYTAQEWLLDKLGMSDRKQQEANLKENPVWTATGEVAANLPFFGIGGLARTASNIAGRVLGGGIAGGIDLAMGGDVKHAAATAAGGALVAGAPTKLGMGLIQAGETAAQKIGISNRAGEKLSIILAGKLTEDPANAQAKADPATGAGPGGAATKLGDDPPGHPGQASAVDAPAEHANIAAAPENSTPGGYAGKATASPGNGSIVSNEPQSQPAGSQREFGKDKINIREGGQEPAPLGTINEDVRQALTKTENPAEAPIAKPPEGQPAERPPMQQAQQEQPPAPPPERAAAPPPKNAATDRTMDLIKSLRDEEARNVAAREAKEAKLTAEKENPSAGSAIDRAVERALGGAKQAKYEDAGARAVAAAEKSPYRNTGKQALQGQPQSTLKAQPKPQPAAPEPTTRYKEGAKDTPEHMAETMNRGLDNLGRNQDARFTQHRMLAREMIKDYPELMGKGGEDIYHAIENKSLDKLSPRLREAWDKLNSKLRPEIDAAEKELVKRGKVPADELGDPTHVHRMRNMPFSLKEWLNKDPTGMMAGMQKPDPFKPLEYRGAEDASGHRIVLQDLSPDKFAVWKDGKQSIYTAPQREEGAKGFKNGDTIDYNGRQYKVDRGTTAEIEKHARADDKGTPLNYKKHAPLSLFEHHQQVMTALEHDDMMRTFKTDKALDPYRLAANTPEAQAKIKDANWKELHGENIPKELQGFAMHPDLAQAIKNNYDPGLGFNHNPIVSFNRALNQFAVRSIFWNPVPHGLNATAHYIIARGEDWIPLKYEPGSSLLKPSGVTLEGYNRFFKSLMMGVDDVLNQKGTLLDMNRAGAPLVLTSTQRRRAHDLMGGIFQASYKSEPRFWGGLADKYGLGAPAKLVKAAYDKSSDILWGWSDIMMSARIHENEMKGMSREKAMSDASIHMPDYVLPIKLLGARGLPSMMADSNVFMFGRYHTKVVDSLAHMTMDALGKNTSVEDRRKAIGNIIALTAMGAVVYPALDKLVQTVTGNKDASMRRSGPLKPISDAMEAAQGKKTYASTAAGLVTMSPGAKLLVEGALQNRDFTGRNIIEPKSPFHKQVAQGAEYVAQNLVSPYKTISDAYNPSSAKSKSGLLHELGTALTHTKVPNVAQKQGEFKGEQIRKQQAEQREKKPRGLIEYGTKQADKAVRSTLRSQPAAPPLPPGFRLQ